MFVRDHCDECQGPADVGLVDEPVRLSIRIWQCVRCGHLTVTAFDWKLREIVDAEVMTREQSREELRNQHFDRVYEKAKQTLRKQKEKRKRR